MFTCNVCDTPTGPRISPIMVAAETRPQTYTFLDSEGEVKMTTGSEIVTEHTLCRPCAGLNPITPRILDHSPVLALAMQAHAQKCNKMLADCLVCQRNIKVFASIPLPAITKALNERQVHTGRMSLAALLVESMLDRSSERVRTKRATADFDAAYPILKAYEQRGGSL